jgi:ABC-type sugar transport system permease subunit
MGTSRALLFYVLYIYIPDFQKGKLGYASALAWLLVIIYRRSKQYVYYETI